MHPLMVANQSKHTVHFSDQVWDEDAPQFPFAWQVGRYLKHYTERYLTCNPNFELKLKTKVVEIVPQSEGWRVVLKSEGMDESRHFDYVVVATGFFGKPIIPGSLQGSSDIPVIHSSEYRDLQGLLGKGRARGGRILVVGGQMSGVEIAGTIATHLSSAGSSPEASEISNIDKYSIHHIIQRPIWVFPLFTSPEVSLYLTYENHCSHLPAHFSRSPLFTLGFHVL